jgi:hypothetical protein
MEDKRAEQFCKLIADILKMESKIVISWAQATDVDKNYLGTLFLMLRFEELKQDPVRAAIVRREKVL